MWQQLVEFIQSQLQTNNFLSGGFLLMALGGLAAWLRKTPEKIWRWCKQRVFMEIEVPDADDAFLWIDKWLATQPYCKNRARWMSVRTETEKSNGEDYDPYSDDDDDRRKGKTYKIIMSPAPGTHWLWWRRRFVVLERERKEQNGAESNSETLTAFRPREVFRISILTFNRQLAYELLCEARDVAVPPDDDRVTVFTPAYQSWNGRMKRRARSMSSVILREGVMETLVKHIDTFLNRKQWYFDRGIPWRWGCLLYGPPGSGKSSTVMALASHFKHDIAILSLANGSLDDDQLRDCMGRVPDGCIVLIEDIDCVFHRREGTHDKQNKVTFSGLLNAIDGVVATEGRLLIMTTNYPNKLDSALIRPGRCDARVFIDNADADQCRRMYQRFFPEAPEQWADQFANQLTEPVSMAAVQGHLLKHCENPQAASNNAVEIYQQPARSSDESQTEDAAEE